MNQATEFSQSEQRDQDDTRHANYDLFILALTIISLFLLLVLILPFVRKVSPQLIVVG